jgi:ubiquinone/menaquinone biosynthesis C-methylase UbiE
MMTTNTASDLERSIASHYGRPGLMAAVLEGLARAGGNPDAPTLDELAPVDEFHTAGRLTTLQALAMMPIAPGMHVVDAGCGLGGTARCLASEHGCRVTGIDLTPDYIELARLLTERMGLSDRCAFHVGSVLALPFADAEFDAGLTFHVAMNIEDRQKFYRELARVLRPGAPLCVFDVMKGPAAGMNYPVPWAETEATSFLKSCQETGALLAESGFQLAGERNLRDFAREYFREVFAKIAEAGGPPPLGLHLLTGENAPEKFANYVKGLDAHQIEPVILIAMRR